MSKSTIRNTPARDRDTVEQRLARMLDSPHLERVVPLLAPETLHRLVLHRGLESCGELVAFATPAQLTGLLDLDLWRGPTSGADEELDVERFGEWLEVLVEVGEEVAARTVAALDLDLVVAGLCRYVRAFDPGTFEPVAQSDDEAPDRRELMDSERTTAGLECEVGGYLVRGRRTDAWDAIVVLLSALDSGHRHAFHAVMRGCRRLSNSRSEVDGLDALLLAPEQHLYDVAYEREQRRSRVGYATPADARAFLALARQPHDGANPVAAAYLRAIDRAATQSDVESAGESPRARSESRGDPIDDAQGSRETAATLGALLELMTEAGIVPTPPRALLGTGNGEPRPERLALLRNGMDWLLHHAETAYLRRSQELAFLANVLLSGCPVQSRPLTTHEASEAAASVCNLGLEASGVGGRPEALLAKHGLIVAFEAGWTTLFHDVSLFGAGRLLSILNELRVVDPETDRDLRAFERELARQRAAGTPWKARAFADVLATLDRGAWRSVVGLLGECPILPAPLTAALGGHPASTPATAFEFISTRAQIGEVRAFMGVLPKLLSR